MLNEGLEPTYCFSIFKGNKECFVCSWKTEPTFRLRGLCSRTKVDKEYVLLPEYTYDEHAFFFGYGENNMLFSQKLKSWLIVEDKSFHLFNEFKVQIKEATEIVGIFKPDTIGNQLPIGLHSWNMTDCGGLTLLKLTAVSLNPFGTNF